jgi:hypothetical protein
VLANRKRIACSINKSSAALALITTAVTTSAITALPAQAGPPRIHPATASSDWRLIAQIAVQHQRVVMTQVDPVSAGDAWAISRSEDPGAIPGGLIEHWNGGAWFRVKPPASLLARFANSSDAFEAIGASSARNVWIFSETGKYLRLNGTKWAFGQVPRLKSEILAPVAVQVFSPGNVWAFGCRAPTLTATEKGCAPGAARFTGKHWEPVPVPGKGAVSQVSAIAPNDMWAIAGP